MPEADAHQQQPQSTPAFSSGCVPLHTIVIHHVRVMISRTVCDVLRSSTGTTNLAMLVCSDTQVHVEK
jgi:hypothetical protein